MSDKSFGDYANRNIVKNPLLSTAVTGLSIEDLTHNAVLVPVAPNQGVFTGSGQTGTHTHTLADTDHDHVNFPSGDSNSTMFFPPPPTSTHSHTLDSQTGQDFNRKPELPTSTVSKASSKSEDDFDVNEYFARLQGTRYVSAPLHSHPDPNLTEPEENLEEISLNDDKAQDVQQSLTADIAQNFSQLPNVLPHVASAVFSSFSSMWNMKSREQTPDDRTQSLQDIQFRGNQVTSQFQGNQASSQFPGNQTTSQFQGNQASSQYQIGPYQEVLFQGSPDYGQNLGANVSTVPLMTSEDVAKTVAPPPKEPPVSGTSNFRLPTKKKYAQIPGLSTREPQQIAFNPLTQNVPSYFIPTEEAHKNIEEIKETIAVDHSSTIQEPAHRKTNENYNIFTPIDDTIAVASDCPSNVFMTVDKQPKLYEETPPHINLQNQIPTIPPPPMFSTQRRDSNSGKSVLPPSVARRIGSNHPVIKQQTLQPTLTDNIFVPTFNSEATDSVSVSTNLYAPTPPKRQEDLSIFPAGLPPQTSQATTGLGPAPPISGPPPNSTNTFPPQMNLYSAKTEKTVPNVFESSNISSVPGVFTPFVLDPTASVVSESQSSGLVSSPEFSGPTSLPPSSSIFLSNPPAAPQAPPSLPTVTPNVSYPEYNAALNIAQIPFNPSSVSENTMKEQSKPLVEPPKAIGANFRMTKKRPQYYSGPIEGFGSISNSIKPIMPTVDSGTFQGALFTPEQPQADVNVPSFDISKTTTTSQFDITDTPPGLPVVPSANPDLSYPKYDANPPYQQYNPFDLSRPTANYEPQEEPKDSKGFGIIGSLKSKLSSIDINKIQSSVTTFFDPGYNNTKKDTELTQENVTYETPQYHAQTQSNFEIFVPNIEQSIPYSSTNATNQNTYYAQLTYDQSNQYTYQHQNPAFGDTNYSYQTCPTNYFTSETPNQQYASNIYFQGSSTEKNDGQFEKSKENTSAQNPQADRAPFETTPLKNYFDSAPSNLCSIENINKTNEAQKITLNTEPFFDLKSNLVITSSENTPESVEERVIKATDKLLSSDDTDYQVNPISNPTVGTCVRDSDYAKAQHDIGSNYVFYTPHEPVGNQYNFPPQPVASEMQPMFYHEGKTDISGYHAQNIESLPIAEHDNIKKDAKSGNVYQNLATGVKDSQNILENINLTQSFSKEESGGIPSLPSASLSKNMPDASNITVENNDVTNLPLYQRAKTEVEKRNESISFFQTINTLDQNVSEHDVSKNDPIFDSKLKQRNDAQISNVNFFAIDQASGEYSSAKQTDVFVDNMLNYNENDGAMSIESVSELNICETCREVNKPEDKEIEIDDVTKHLIENITSPIQLSNPVEVPLPEDDSNERVEFDESQFEEIAHITEETIESLHSQSAAELLGDDNLKSINYGWGPEQKYASNASKRYDYDYYVDPNAVFLGDSLQDDEVPANASDELKAEYKHQEVILPREMSIPSAPPAEDDSKSDETGALDVHSIELDAKEDFSLYEEFVIEPSETDDDKIEYKEREKTEESEPDSFAKRVADFAEHKAGSSAFEVHNQPISMASYFDTGNYAADTHYRNTLNSPSNFSIPPGFEEEFRKRLALAKAKEEAKMVPDTQTQTKHTVSVTTAQCVMPVAFNVVTTASKPVYETFVKPSEMPVFAPESLKTPESSSIFSSNRVETSIPEYKFDSAPEIASEAIKTDPGLFSGPNLAKESPIFQTGAFKVPEDAPKFDSDAVDMPKSSSFFGSQAFIPETSHSFNPSETSIPKSSFFNPIPDETVAPTERKAIPSVEKPILPDPLNFFTDTNTDTTPDNNNRLASYFSSPPKTDHAKSFFELSQSQNHYKHASDSSKYDDLMKDLTSIQNFKPPKELTVRHVNYFTIEHDVILPKFNKGDSSAEILMDNDDKNFELITHCNLCTALINQKHYKVKSTMNNNSEDRSTEPTMETCSNEPKNSVTVNFDGVQLNEDPNESIGAQAENRSTSEYGPVKHHWFYRVDVEEKSIWRGFSVQDSRALETSFLSPDLNENTLVPTDGGRYDVNLVGRLRIPVYWSDKPTNVRRCSWFYKGTTDPRYVPYTESVAEKLEEEYYHGITTGNWHRRLVLPNGEVVVMHGPNVMVYFLNNDSYSAQPQSCSRPRVIRRGHDDSEIEDAEPSSIDHLLLLCHGVGSACDMRFRSVEEVVEDFRSTSLQLVQSHYKNSYDQGIVNRVEVLPISWHAALHCGETGVDRRMAQITLDSIPRLRNFTNDTVLDVLFYTSPIFCQTILNTVGNELNRIYRLFKLRNPSFKGGISLGGHSLGSVILYDLLCHQTKEDRRDSQLSEKSYVSGPAGTGQSTVRYPHLEFEPAALYALGSPIAIFECIRGVESLGRDFSLPTCRNFFNIFHPYDPIAYRIEPLINPRLKELKPYLIPHHKGRKRMHLELKDTMARVGADLKQKLMESLRSTWNKWKSAPTDGSLERVVEEEMDREQLFDETKEELAKEKELSTPEMLGHLNRGRRVDYVLQEAPLEVINEYLFAMRSHVGYWESEDTMLLMLREIYSALGVQPDCTVPQQSMTVQRTRCVDGSTLACADSPSTSGGFP